MYRTVHIFEAVEKTLFIPQIDFYDIKIFMMYKKSVD